MGSSYHFLVMKTQPSVRPRVNVIKLFVRILRIFVIALGLVRQCL
jgi:hypothetical protein